MLVMDMASTKVLEHLLLIFIRLKLALLIEDMNTPDHFRSIVVAIFA